MAGDIPKPVLFKLGSNALTTLEHLKLFLSIPAEDTSYDDFLILLINYASGWVESQIGRKLGLRDYKEQVKGSGYQELILRNYPIREVLQITEGVNGHKISSSEYSFEETGHIGVIFKDNGWTRNAYYRGLVPDPLITKRYITVEYKAGYILPKDATEDSPEDWLLPYDLQGIIWQLAEQELALNASGAGGLSAFSIADVSWTFDKAPRQSWLDIIGIYKRVV